MVWMGWTQQSKHIAPVQYLNGVNEIKLAIRTKNMCSVPVWREWDKTRHQNREQCRVPVWCEWDETGYQNKE